MLKQHDIRGLIDDRSEKTGRKIRDAELKKIPYMLIVGEREENENSVSVRMHGGGDKGSYKIEDFITMVNDEVERMIDNN